RGTAPQRAQDPHPGFRSSPAGRRTGSESPACRLRPSRMRFAGPVAEAFAQLDAANRSRSIAVGAEQNAPMIESASLSTTDKKFVRREIFEDRVLSAAKCA